MARRSHNEANAISYRKNKRELNLIIPSSLAVT